MGSHDRSSPEVLEAVRIGCEEVACRARFVRIRTERLRSYARELLEGSTPGGLDPAAHFLGHGEDTVAFFVVLDTINFGSGCFPLLRKRPGSSGYFTIATSLTERFRTRGPWTADELAAMRPEECAAVFGQEDGPADVQELMVWFARALRDLGHYVRSFGGRCAGLVEAAGQSASTLVALLARMPLFRDVAWYRGVEVPFYKRAQLLASDLALAFEGREWGRFDDLDRLTMFADNLVPHVLRVDGVLEYDEGLLTRIERGDLIPAGSEEEVEIRACAVHAVEILVRECHALGAAMPSHRLDAVLWTRGQAARYKALPRHRTRTTAY